MVESVFQRVVVPVASRDDAAATTTALVPYVEGRDCTVIAVHVIEKADGALDKASVEQREQAARGIFAVVTHSLADTGIDLRTEIRYGADIATTLIDAAHVSDPGGRRREQTTSG